MVAQLWEGVGDLVFVASNSVGDQDKMNVKDASFHVWAGFSGVGALGQPSLRAGKLPA